MQAHDQLAGAGTDVIVDAGRVDVADPLAPWLQDSDLAILVVRPTLPAVAAAHRLVAGWTAAGTTASAIPLGLVVVESPSSYRPREVAHAVGLELVATIPFDPASARVHSEGAAPGRGFARSGYVRSLSRLAGDLGHRAGVLLDAPPEPGVVSGTSTAGEPWRAGS
jgi:Flp pilus assembly CpaE family ATPase